MYKEGLWWPKCHYFAVKQHRGVFYNVKPDPLLVIDEGLLEISEELRQLLEEGEGVFKASVERELYLVSQGVYFEWKCLLHLYNVLFCQYKVDKLHIIISHDHSDRSFLFSVATRGLDDVEQLDSIWHGQKSGEEAGALSFAVEDEADLCGFVHLKFEDAELAVESQCDVRFLTFTHSELPLVNEVLV